MGQFRKGDSFTVRDPQGNAFNVVTWVEYVDMGEGHAARPNWVASGFETFRLEDGRAVQARRDGSFELGESGAILQRVSRRATARGS